jgi:hypothetical protein
MGCHLGWHFPVGCPLRGGKGENKHNRDFCSIKNNEGKKDVVIGNLAIQFLDT